ncbi:MAG TPA: hypothetical protein VGR26_11205 [Acidimicrobiales bacterium]|nr:hypothetical protein [Acidimicrobiales bacterium]
MRNGYPIERSQVQRCRHAENNERGGGRLVLIAFGATLSASLLLAAVVLSFLL